MTPTTPEKKWRVGIVTGHPTQWEGPLFGHLQRTSALDLHVFYGSRFGLDAAVEPESKIRFAFDMPGLVDGYEHSFETPSRRAVVRLARAFRGLDAIIFEGYSGFPQRQALAAALALKIPRVLRLDSTHLYGQSRLKRIGKQLALPPLFKRFGAFLALSSKTAEYLESYGVPKSAIVVSTYRVHNQWYASEAARWRGRSDELRKELQLARFSRIVLAILRFEHRENPLEFLQAASAFAESHPDVGFVLVGAGTLDAEVRRFVESRRLTNVVLPGFRPITDLPKYFALATVFVHPAVQECWGLSVNEAMASGVPAVVSDQVGCRYDLIPNDAVGRVYPSGDVEGLSEAIRRLLDDSGLHHDVASAASARIDEFSYDRASKEFERAADLAILARQRGQ